jgi:hypothetical protein
MQPADWQKAYDAAIKLIDKEARSVWSFFGGMVAANSILIGLLVASFSPAIGLIKTMPYLPSALGILGVVVCGIWWILMLRTRAFYDYYTMCAGEYEKQAFGDEVHMIRDADVVAEGGKASIKKKTPELIVGGSTLKESDFRLTGLAHIRAKKMIYGIIILFAGIYVFGVLIVFLQPSIIKVTNVSKDEVKDSVPLKSPMPIEITWTSKSATLPIQAGEVSPIVVDCPPLKKIMSGGFVSDTSNDRVRVTASYPVGDSQWRVNLRNTSAQPSAASFTVFASCGAPPNQRQ